MTLYDLIRRVWCRFGKRADATLEQVKRDEAAAKQRTIEAAERLRNTTRRN